MDSGVGNQGLKPELEKEGYENASSSFHDRSLELVEAWVWCLSLLIFFSDKFLKYYTVFMTTINIGNILLMAVKVNK